MRSAARRLVLVGALVVTALVPAARTGAAPQEVLVQASNFRFCPESAPMCTPLDAGAVTTIKAGTAVKWVYTDLACDVVAPCPGHNVEFSDVKGKVVKGTDAVLLTRTFAKPGRYEYICTPHEGFDMTGAVVVEP